MVADVVKTQRARVVDEHAEQAATARQVADGTVGVLVDPARQEAGELAASLVEDAERDVACPCEVGRGLQEAVEDRLEVELGQQAAPGVDEAREPVLVQAVQRGHARRRAYRRPCAATWGATVAAAGTTSTGQAAWRRISSSRPAITITSTSARVWATSAPVPRPATRVAAPPAPEPGLGPATPRRQRRRRRRSAASRRRRARPAPTRAPRRHRSARRVRTRR